MTADTFALTLTEQMSYTSWLLTPGSQSQLTAEELANWRAISDTNQAARFVLDCLKARSEKGPAAVA